LQCVYGTVLLMSAYIAQAFSLGLTCLLSASRPAIPFNWTVNSLLPHCLRCSCAIPNLKIAPISAGTTRFGSRRRTNTATRRHIEGWRPQAHSITIPHCSRTCCCTLLLVNHCQQLLPGCILISKSRKPIVMVGASEGALSSTLPAAESFCIALSMLLRSPCDIDIVCSEALCAACFFQRR
jgi:hypothetical protein